MANNVQLNPAAIPTTPPHITEANKRAALLAKAKVVRERMATRHSDITGLKPSKQYCWVNLKEDRQVYYQGLGWTLCNDLDLKSPFKQPDGTIRRADTILYEIDMDFYEALCMHNILKGIEGIESAETGFVDTLGQQKIPTFKPAVQ